MELRIFREYDIRALAEEELTDEVVYQIGRAFGTYLIDQRKSRIALGRDNRLSSERITRILTDGILSTGCNIVNIGETTTPILCFSIAFLRVDGSVMVTGSHNSAEFNGIKLQIGNTPLFGQALKGLSKIIESNHFAQGKGRLSTQNVVPYYIQRIKERICLKRPLRVVVDCGNGNTGVLAPDLFRELGCDVIALYCDSDGRFPNHLPNPAVSSNLKDLIEEVKRKKADIGVAFDGDGNRIGVVDEMGRIISPDIVLGLLARDVLKQRGAVKVVCDIKASQALVEDVEKHGGTVVVCRTGYPFILEKMFSEKAALAGELTGHICFNEDPFVFGDAIFVSCQIFQLLSRTAAPLSQLFSNFPKYFSTPEFRIPCSDELKFEVVQRLQQYFSERYNALTVDGIKAFFDNQGWVLIRASNTEPVLSVRFEANTQDDLENIKFLVIAQMRNIGGIDVDI